MPGNPVNSLIRNVLLQERSDQHMYETGSHRLKWTFANEFDLIFVAVYQSLLHNKLLYLDDFLKAVVTAFIEMFGDRIKSTQGPFDFTQRFDQLQLEIEAQWREKLKSSRQQQQPFRKRPTARGVLSPGGAVSSPDSSISKSPGASSAGTTTDEEASGSSAATTPASSPAPSPQASPSSTNLRKPRPFRPKPKASPTQAQSQSQPQSPTPTPTAPTPAPGATSSPATSGPAGRRVPLPRGRGAGRGRRRGGKKPNIADLLGAHAAEEEDETVKRNRVWDKKVTSEEAASLNFALDAPASSTTGTATDTLPASAHPAGDSEGMRESMYDATGRIDLDADFPNAPVQGDYADDDEEPEGEAAATATASQQSTEKKSRLFGFFRGLTGQKTIERATLDPVLQRFRQGLLVKNVAAEIADQLCESVAISLVGQKMGTFQGMRSTVQTALDAALTRILTPQHQVDVLRGIQRAKELHRPYSIVFCGVNGVGKSTNLSKIAYWLNQNGVKVLIAACDSFRSGAVEQLRVHARCLKLPLYERGYGRDAATVAREAIMHAQREGHDCVLIDTQGRMQDNDELMKALVKVVNVNTPDLVLFVGEALVGNDAIDQLTQFDSYIQTAKRRSPPRGVDGIVLTKFDTIDDKVGAALSMVYKTGHPILFVGTGQTYTDVRRLNVKTIISALLH
eukprot:gnl/Trimastix_PCT/1825.p1 GENE.gnl/Trimastix_PCT/1825~~gnl/Trimastix_PCT/1825.p1  ORF type:complete len:715 (-),score=158.68 gnl/Trimastix_PCT/1825:146-2185(-)